MLTVVSSGPPVVLWFVVVSSCGSAFLIVPFWLFFPFFRYFTSSTPLDETPALLLRTMKYTPLLRLSRFSTNRPLPLIGSASVTYRPLFDRRLPRTSLIRKATGPATADPNSNSVCETRRICGFPASLGGAGLGFSPTW